MKRHNPRRDRAPIPAPPTDPRGPRAARRLRGFRSPVRHDYGPTRYGPGTPVRDPAALVDPHTNERPPAPMSPARVARRAARAAQREAHPRVTRRQRAEQARAGELAW